MGRPPNNTVYERIKKRIVNGDIPAGTRMSEAVLAKELGVSRTPIRTCLTRLAGEGLVKMVPNDGMYVETPSRADILELMELRLVLEPYAASLAAQRATANELQIMEKACQAEQRLIRETIDRPLLLQERAVAEALDRRLVVEVEVPFHTTLIRASRNARLVSTIFNMQMLNKIWAAPLGPEPITVPILCIIHVHHRRILRHLHNKDAAKASQATQRHLLRGTENIAKGFDRMQEERRMKEVMENTVNFLFWH